MAKRKYTKRSDYWDLRKKSDQTTASSAVEKLPTLDYELESLASDVSLTRSGSSITRGRTRKGYNYDNVDNLPLPFETNGGIVTVSKAIELCQKAYYGVSIFRNTIDGMTEFSSTKLHFTGEKKAVAFANQWYKAINGNSFQQQFFREYYRGGNVFIYRFDGKFDQKDEANLKTIFSKMENKIPLLYTIFNPAHMGAENGLVSQGSYVKVFSTFEIERLKNPKTDVEKSIYNALPDDLKQQIKNYHANKFLSMKLDMGRLTAIFYKKQPYEALATPLGFPVLDDIDYKLYLKRQDRALLKAIDNLILLITMGDKPSEGGVNVENIKAMRQLFKTPALGRVLISDYTTKAEFITPDIKDMLGPEKYAVVNEDIKNGLQNILVGSEKFANQFIKTKVFIERLQEGQEIYLNEFLIPELKRVCDAMGITEYPTPVFEKINLEDQNIANRVIVRLIELGILTPSEGFKVMETGLYPDEDTMKENQKKYKKDRDAGLYEPLVGGSKEAESGEGPGKPKGTKDTEKSAKKVGVRTKASEEEVEEFFAVSNIVETFKEANKLVSYSESLFKKASKTKELNELQQEMATGLAKAVIANANLKDWKKTLNQCFKNQCPPSSSEITAQIDNIADKYEVESYLAAILHHSKNFTSKK